MAGFWIVMINLFIVFTLLIVVCATYIGTLLTLLYLIRCTKKLTKLKIRDNELRERIFELKTKNL